MITTLLGLFCALLGWALGWIHSIYWDKKDHTALLNECVTLGIENEAYRRALEKASAPASAPLQDSSTLGTAMP